MMFCLPSKAKEKDIYKFYFAAGCGKIRDIRIIRDQKSGKSKGVAYVEFFTAEGCTRALAMNNRPFKIEGKDLPFAEVRI
jgi:RNA-binding protein 39